ncbi:MAG TPA: 6-carboxytetrahydropterin synthase [Anaerolineales bacterium]|nr:6-carboxytetrahydropterin synthase [Anaerolineales bacterium]
MYIVAVRRAFDAQHYLIGGDWGPENELHTHHYQVEVQLEGPALDVHGYLVDIVDIERNLEAQTARFRDQILNVQPEFAGLNPSIEHFARILCLELAAGIQAPNLTGLTLTVWENEIAWASYRHELRST